MATSDIIQEVTSVSTDAEKLFAASFAAGQRRTAASGEEAMAWNLSILRGSPDVGIPYDPVIVRFYEEIIASLQKELARYKAIVEAALQSHLTEMEPESLEPGPVVNLSAGARSKMKRARPGIYTSPERL